MAINLDDLLREADAVIEKRASAKAPAVAQTEEDDITKLARALAQDSDTPAATEKTASAVVPAAFELTPFEKVAHAIAMVETLVNIEQLQKLASFEENALATGHTQAQVDDFLEKKAADLKPVHKYVTIPGALMALGAGAGHSHGKKKGYEQAMSDVTQAMSQGQE